MGLHDGGAGLQGEEPPIWERQAELG
jgi:hypothetical protein